MGPTLIAMFVGYIAYQQWQVNQASLRERLFERRFKIFKDTQIFLSHILREGRLEDSALTEFFEAPQMARFLFGNEMADYLKEIRTRAIKMHGLEKSARRAEVGPKRSEPIDKEYAEIKWLNGQLETIFDKFEPYLGFKHHK